MTTTTELEADIDALLKSLDAGLSALGVSSSPLPPADGVSLLDLKNELLLSYLHNLVFLIILKLRHASHKRSHGALHSASTTIQKLAELKVYLEKGVRPLEGQLKYQIDKVTRAADDSGKAAARTPKTPRNIRQDGDDDGSEDSATGSIASVSAPPSPSLEVDDRSYAPRIATLAKAIHRSNGEEGRAERSRKDAPYKPPRITPTTMPAPPLSRTSERKRRSNLMDEYIETELSAAPAAQPSIGSNNTILDRGRGSLSGNQRAKERERTEYEERNLTRLPAENRAERRKARLRGEDARSRDMFGGEDWTGLGGLGDRVSRSVRSTGSNRENILERRQKRGRDTQDGPRGDGSAIGETFEKRRKVLLDRAERKLNRGKR